MTKSKFEVAESPIHGKGLFATAPIKKGEFLGNLKTRAAKKDGPYVLWCDDGKGREVICDFRFINHSRKANVAYYDDLTVMALKNIKPGEELVHNYGDEWED
ncbi:SET domain-containing protein [Thiohalophilus sp.]|uniref:SET domain-containing protein n=1 Tax=Thiohalophilus sp. TaxID=3028392 RepID=UPI0039766C29